MARNNSKWLEMAPNGSTSVKPFPKKMPKGGKKVPKTLQKIIQSGKKKANRAPNGSIWLQMVPNFTKLLKKKRIEMA